MSEIFITSGKVLQKSVEFEFYKRGDTTGKNGKPAHQSYDHTKEPHEDLINAFGLLDVHVALIFEAIQKKTVKNIEQPPESVSIYHATGFHIKGSADEIDAYKLHGYKTLSTGKTSGIDCPLERNLDEGDANAYLFINHLRLAILKCQDELEQYMNGKYAPEAQQELFDKE